jgi:hypothetical protein
VSEAADGSRPLCSEASRARGEGVGATASRIEHWLLIEYGGYWPYEPLDAAVFAGSLREHLAAQLAGLPRSRLLLVKRSGRASRDRTRVFYGRTPERGRSFHGLELEGHPDLLGIDFRAAFADGSLGEPLDHPLLLVCTHGIRDRCCARYGQALCRGLLGAADPEWVWQASHVGGDRFAGNLVCLPEGLYFGHLGRRDVRALLAAYLAGRIDLEHYRGRSCYPFPVQAAELEVRRESGLTAFHDLRLLRVEHPGRDCWQVRLLAEVSGREYEVDVRAELADEETYLTCRAAEPKRARRFVAQLVG